MAANGMNVLGVGSGVGSVSLLSVSVPPLPIVLADGSPDSLKEPILAFPCLNPCPRLPCCGAPSAGSLSSRPPADRPLQLEMQGMLRIDAAIVRPVFEDKPK